MSLPSTRPRAALSPRFVLTAAFALVTTANCSDSATGPERETVQPIALSQSVTGSLAPGASLAYSLTLPANVVSFVAFQATSGRLSDTLDAAITVVGGTGPLAVATSAGSQPGLFDALLTLPASPQARDVVLRITGRTPSVTSPFMLMLQTLGAGPEHNVAAFPVAREIRESIDAGGDVDEFALTSFGGHLVRIELAAETPFADGLTLELLDGTSVLASLATTSAQATLGELSTPWFELPRNGAYALRVRAGDEQSTTTGRYRVRVYSNAPPAPLDTVGLGLQAPTLDTLSADVPAWGWDFYAPSAGDVYSLTLEAVEAQPDDSVVATIVTVQGADTLARLIAEPGGGVVSWLVPPSSTVQRLAAIVRGRRLGAEVTYRIRLGSTLPDAPEHVPAALVVGDTVAGETFGAPYDLDQYTFDLAPADSELVIMLVPVESPKAVMGLSLRDRNGVLIDEWAVTGQWDELERTATYLRVPPGAGPFTLTVSGEFHGVTQDDGGYVLRVTRVDHGVEGGNPVLLPNTVRSSAIEQPGDVDEYALEVTEGEEYYFHHRILLPGAEQSVGIWDGTADQGRLMLPDHVVPIDEQRAHYRWMVPRTATATVRVQNGQVAGPSANFPTPYELEAQRVNRAPETMPATGWVWTDTIRGEQLERRGDVDEFFVTIDETRMTSLSLIARRTQAAGGVHLSIFREDGSPFTNLALVSEPLTDTMRVIPHAEFTAGTYRFVFESTALVPVGYDVYLQPSHLGPETVNDTIPLGVWVEGEAIDSIGDMDRYVLAVDSGVRYVAELEPMAGASGGFAFYVGASFVNTAGARTVNPEPATRWINAMVTEWPVIGPPLGPYRFRVRPMNPLPESVPSALVLGTPVEGEAIDMIADQDEYTFTATAGTVLRLAASYPGMANGARLNATVRYSNGFTFQSFPLTGTPVDFTVAVNDTFTLTIRGQTVTSDIHVGPYSFTLSVP